jgi:hypothetical protein
VGRAVGSLYWSRGKSRYVCIDRSGKDWSLMTLAGKYGRILGSLLLLATSM